MIVKNFVRIAWTVIEKMEKSRKMAVVSVIIGLILAMFLRSQSFHFDAIAHTEASLGVQ